MANVLLNWSTTKVSVPASTDLMQYKATIDGVGSTLVAFGQLSVQFDNVAPGDYIARVALTNQTGSRVDFEKTAAFTVPADTVLLDAPDVITVNLV